MGDSAENRFEETAFGKRDRLTGQPFQVAVLAQVDNHMAPELLPKPDIECQVIVRRWQVGRMVGFIGINIVAAGRLNPRGQFAVTVNRQRESVILQERISCSFAPARLDTVGRLPWQSSVSAKIIVQRKADAGVPVSRTLVEDIRGPLKQGLHQRGRVFRFVRDFVAVLLENWMIFIADAGVSRPTPFAIRPYRFG